MDDMSKMIETPYSDNGAKSNVILPSQKNLDQNVDNKASESTNNTSRKNEESVENREGGIIDDTRRISSDCHNHSCTKSDLVPNPILNTFRDSKGSSLTQPEELECNKSKVVVKKGNKKETQLDIYKQVYS